MNALKNRWKVIKSKKLWKVTAAGLINFLSSSGQLKSVKKGKPVAYAFSGITSKKSTRYDCRGKKCNRGPAKSYANNKKQSIRSSRVQKNGNKKLKSSWNEKGTERVPRSNNITKKKYATL